MNRSTLLKIVPPILLAIAAVLIIGYYKFPSLFRPHTTVTKFTDTSGGSLEDYYQLGQSLSVRGSIATTSATFLAVGDIMLSRNVASVVQKSGDADSPFLNMSAVLKSTDFNFGNLESPVAPKNPIIGGSSLIFGAASTSLSGLKDYNFQIINLANNHAFDQGLAGVDVTRSTLDNLNIAHEGTGDNLDEAWTPAVVTANGIKICFIGASFSSLNDGGKATNNYVARIEDTARLQSAITTAKTECDFVVVTMHAGVEYTRMPNDAQIKFAHTAIDDGADIVIGAHPHWVQTIEKYCPNVPAPLPLGEGDAMQRAAGGGSSSCANPKYIFYSLGNFIFDQAFSQDTSEGLTLKITVSKTGATPVSPSFSKEGAGGSSLSADNLQGPRIPTTLDSIQLIPVIITNSQPRPATSDESKNILDKIKQTSTILK